MTSKAGHYKGLSNSALKMIAAVTMLVDHIAAVLLMKLLMHKGAWELTTVKGSPMLNILSTEHMDMIYLYQLMRDIGRISFPIYCFLLVEGFLRTRNMRNYIERILLFAFLSEIPFDLALHDKVFYWEYQNVMFTLFWGLLAMYISHKVDSRTDKWYAKWPMILLVWGLAALAAEGMLTDYGAKGVMGIMILYLLRHMKSWQLMGGAAAFLWEIPAPAAFLLIGMYNEEKGRPMKPFFYLFYPVHLFVLYAISLLL